MSESITKQEMSVMEDFLRDGIIIPPQPEIAIRIESLARNLDARSKDVAALIGQDSGLTAVIFRLVGTVAAGGFKMPSRSGVTSLEQVVAVLGMRQIANVVKSAMLRSVVGEDLPAYEKFWERSSDIALLCSIIAQKQVAVCNVFFDQAYMLGLFHDCGVPILMQRFPGYRDAFLLISRSGSPDYGAEDELLHTDHAVVGYLLSRYWHLPDSICRAIRCHHDVLDSGHPSFTLVSMLRLAIHCYNVSHGYDDSEWFDFRKLALNELGIHPEGAQEFMEDVLDIFHHRK